MTRGQRDFTPPLFNGSVTRFRKNELRGYSTTLILLALVLAVPAPSSHADTYFCKLADSSSNTSLTCNLPPDETADSIEIQVSNSSFDDLPDGESAINAAVNGSVDVRIIMTESSINATGGNTVQAVSEDGDVSAEVSNISYIRTGGGGGGNALFAETVNGNINATFTGQGGIMSKESEGANGFLAQTQTGDITATFDRLFSGIFMFPRGKRDTYSNGKGATFTSASGNINVLLTNTASILAPSLGDSHGLEAVTGEDGDINIVLRNGDSCIAGRNGAIARTAQGDINFHLSDALIVGLDGYGINAISAVDGNIAIVGERGSVIGGGIYATTGGILSVTSEGEDGLNVWTNEDSRTTIRSTGQAKIFNSKVWANGARAYTFLVFRGVEITGAQVWSNGAGSTSIRDFGSGKTKTDISGSSRVWANGASSSAVATFRVTAKGSQVWVEGDNSNAILAFFTADISGGSQVWANGASSSAVYGATATVNIASGSRVWANGVNSSAVSARTADISGGSQVWSNGANSDSLKAADADISGSQVWTEGDNSNAVVVTRAVNIASGSQVWSSGANSDSLKAADADISGSRVWTEGDNSNAVVVTGAVNITSGSQVWSNGVNSSAVVAGTIFVNQSEGWRESGSSHVITGGGGAFDLKLFDSNISANGGGNGSLIFVDGGGSDITVFASNLTALPFRNTMDLSSNGGITVSLFNESKLNRGSSDATTLNALGRNRDVTVTTTDSTINAASGATALRAVTTGSGKTRIDINGNAVVAAYGQPEADGGTAVRAHSQTSEVTLYMRGTSKAFTDSAGGNSVHLSSNYTVAQNPPSSYAGGNRAVTAALEGNASISASGDGANALFIEGPETTERLELVMGGASKIFVTGKGNAAVINSNGKVRTAISGNSQIYAAREGSSALFATSNSSSSRNFDNLDISVSGAARIFTNGADSDTIRTNSASILNPGGSLPKGAIFRLEDKAQIYSDGDSSNAIYHVQHTRQRDVDFLIAATAKLFANGADSFALHIREDSQTITGRSYIGATVVVKDEAEIYATGDRSVALRADMNDGDLIYVNVSDSAKIFTNGDYSSAVEMDLRHANMTFNMSESAQVSTAGNHSTAINAAGDLITPSLTPVDFFLYASNTAQILAGDADSTAVRSQMVDGATKIIVSGKGSITAQGARSDAINATSLGGARGTIGIYLNGSVPSPGETDSSASVYLSTNGSSSGVIRTQTVDGDTTVFIAGGSKVFASGDMSRAISAVTTNGEIDLTVGGQAEVRAEGEGSLAVFFTTTGSGSTKITTESGASVTGNVSLSENRDVFHNNGSFTGSGNTGDDDDVVNNKGTFTLTGDFDMGAGDDTFVNIDGGMVVGDDTHTITPTPTTGTQSSPSRHSASSPSRHSVPDTESSIQLANQYWIPASAGMTEGAGNSRFRLSSADPAPEDTTATINFGDGDDRFINNGTIVIQDTGGFAGLEKITFGENSTLVVSADPEEMADKPLIDIEGEITAEDVKGFNVEVDVPGTHINEYTIFEADDLPGGEERQEVVDIINEKIGERASVEADGNGNLFVTATSHKDTSLDVYDALIQSAYRSDRNFADKLARGCGTSGAASDEIDGEFWTGGCVWATSGGRYTRHTSAIQYDEDVYSFTGGASAPFSGVLVSIAGGYEISTIDASAETEIEDPEGGTNHLRGLASAGGDATRFMGGIFAEGVIDEFVVDGNLRYVSTNWEATRTADSDSYSADVDATVFGGAIAVTKPFLSGKFALLPRLELGASYITADKFVENSLTIGTDADDAAMDKFYVDETSELLVYVSPSIEARSPVSEMLSMWMRAGADVQVLNPESEIEGRLIRDGENDGDDSISTIVPRDGTMDRVMFTYSAGMEYSPYDRLNISIEYGGGTSASFNTFVQQFRGGVNYKF